MAHISFDSSNLSKFIQDNELGEMQAMVNAADEQLRKGTGAGAAYTDWLHLPTNYDQAEFARIKQVATKIKSDSKVLVVIGIGGSYLGARAAVDFLNGAFFSKRNLMKIGRHHKYCLPVIQLVHRTSTI